VITGTGMYVPPKIVNNNDLSRIMDTTDEWIQVRTGIVERRFAARDEATSDIAVPAALQAMESAGCSPDTIDYLVLATMTPDYYFPGSAPFLQRKLGLGTIPCLDIRQQCAGYLYALQIADAVIRSGQHRRALVVGAEVHSCLQPWDKDSWDVAMGDAEGPVTAEQRQRNTQFRDRTVLFGDGAGATVVEAAEGTDRGIIDCLIHCDGNEAERLWTKAAGSAFRPYISEEMIASGDITPIVEGRKVYALAVTAMPR